VTGGSAARRPARGTAWGLGGSALALALLGGCTADDATTLRLSSWADDIEQQLENRNLREFEAREPDVRVVNDAISTQAEYREQVLTSIAAGAPPDVFLLDNIDVPAFASRDVLLDLGPLARRVGLDTTAIDPRVRGIFTWQGRLVAFPKGYTPMVLVYNRRLFREAGVSEPGPDWTWDEFMAAARALTRDTDGDGRVDQWGTVFDRRAFLWMPWLWSGGGDVLCPDGRSASGCLDSPATVAALDWYIGWVTRDSIVPRIATLRRSLGDQFRLFNSGRVAMMTTGHFWVPRFRPYVEQGRLDIGFAPIPHRTGVSPVTVVYAAGWAVPANAPRRKLAVELAAWLADTAAERRRADQGLELPAIARLGSEVAARDTLGWESVFLTAMAGARAPWGARVRGWREVEDRLPAALDEVLLGGQSLQAALGRAAKDIDAVLRETEQ
jgi:multiple sugar transport system substrate-binding protein